MVSEKPPRRSRANKEPVTIDLTAEETAAIAEPVRADDTDEPVTSIEAEPKTSEPAASPETVEPSANTGPKVTETLSTPAAAGTTGTSAPPETPRFDEPEPGEKSKVSSHTAQKAESAAENKPWTTKPAEDAKAEHKRETPPPPPLSASRQKPGTSPATSTLIAAGIFGGIVALLLAGSMQYAGYLPGAASSSTVSETDVSAELATLRQEIAALANRTDQPSDALESRIAALESSTSASAPDEALTQRLAALESELSGIRSATEANAGRLQQAEAQIADRGPEQQAARAVAAAALKGAIDRGGAFEAELQTYKTLSADDPAIAQLEPLATKGVLSRLDLQRQASDVANAMIEAIAQPDPNEGIASRLLSSAMSVVKVRKVGDVTGNTPEDAVARFEDRLRAGDLPAAAREWDTLPDPAKAASQPFKQELDARIEVENLVGAALTRAIAGTQG